MKHIRDLIAKEILFSPSKALNVDVLDNHLEIKVLFDGFTKYCILKETFLILTVGSHN